MSVRFSLVNRSGYDTEDLRQFFAKGLVAMGVREKKRILVVTAPQRSKGCADIGTCKKRSERRCEGDTIVIAIAPPSRYSLRRLARLLMHEIAHTMGFTHGAMPHALLYSLGPCPSWARGTVIRYRHRAPNQMRGLGERKLRRRQTALTRKQSSRQDRHDYPTTEARHRHRSSAELDERRMVRKRYRGRRGGRRHQRH